MAELGPYDGYTCPRCDYDLRGTPASTCPECGQSLDLSELQRRQDVKRSDVRFARWMAIGAGAILVLTIIAELYFTHYLGPHLRRERELPLWRYEGDLITKSAMMLPFLQLILLLNSFCFALIFLFTKNLRAGLFSALAILLSLIGLWAAIGMVSHFMD